MDVWRPLVSENAFPIFAKWVESRVKSAASKSHLKLACDHLMNGLNTANEFLLKYIGSTDKVMQQQVARYFAFGLSRIYMGSLLLEHAVATNDPVDIEVAQRWCSEKPLISIPSATSVYRNLSASLALDIDPATGKPRNIGNVDVAGKPRSML